MNSIRAAVVTISDKGYRGQREDVSGPLLVRLLRDTGAEVVRQTIVPDEQEEIARLLVTLADEAPGEVDSGQVVSEELALDLIVTTGGTGVTPRDVTPEATKAVIQREMPGLAEALRFTGYSKTPLAVISRGVAGIRSRTLIVNLPGSPNAVRDGMETLAPILPHTAQRLHEYLGYDGQLFGTQHVVEYQEETRAHQALTYNHSGAIGTWVPSQLPPGQVLRKPAPLFKKLDESVIDEEYARLEG